MDIDIICWGLERKRQGTVDRPRVLPADKKMLSHREINLRPVVSDDLWSVFDEHTVMEDILCCSKKPQISGSFFPFCSCMMLHELVQGKSSLDGD